MQVIGRGARIARHHKRHEAAEINLTSMIDMMTILVFFLLVHGGFIRLALLELNLPSAQSQATAEPPNLELEITVRSSGIEIGDRTAGLMTRIEKTDRGYDFAQLKDYLAKLKAQFPDKTDATLLLVDEAHLLVASGAGDAIAGLWTSHPLLLMLAQRALQTIG